MLQDLRHLVALRKKTLVGQGPSGGPEKQVDPDSWKRLHAEGRGVSGLGTLTPTKGARDPAHICSGHVCQTGQAAHVSTGHRSSATGRPPRSRTARAGPASLLGLRGVLVRDWLGLAGFGDSSSA